MSKSFSLNTAVDLGKEGVVNTGNDHIYGLRVLAAKLPGQCIGMVAQQGDTVANRSGSFLTDISLIHQDAGHSSR